MVAPVVFTETETWPLYVLLSTVMPVTVTILELISPVMTG